MSAPAQDSEIAIICRETGGPKDVDLAEVLVHHIDPAIFVDGKPGWEHEPAGPAVSATIADEQQQLPRFIEDLEIPEGRVRDVDVARSIRIDAFRPRELSRTVSDATHLARK